MDHPPAKPSEVNVPSGGVASELSSIRSSVHAASHKAMRYFPDRSGWFFADLKELFVYRELLLMFLLRDLKIRYRQVMVGILWVLLQPTLGMLIFLGIFWLVNATPADGSIRYASDAAIVYLGMLLWQFVAASMRDATSSLVNYRHVITKIAFPRLMLPLSSVLCAAFDLLIASSLFPIVIWITGDSIQWQTAWLLPFVFGALLAFVVGAVAWLSSLNAFYRDVGYALPFALQLGMFVSPVIYDLSRVQGSGMIPTWVKFLYESNPVANSIGWMRAIILGGPSPYVLSTIFAGLLSMFILVTGMLWFRTQNERLADRI